jgi:hypothetical protein
MLKKVKTIFEIFDVRSLFGICSLLWKYVILVAYSVIKSGIFGQPDLFDPKLTRHFLQYARRAHARISSS